MPAPNVLHPNCDATGFIRYRPAFTSLRVDPGPDSGRRVTINDDGHIAIFDLTEEQAAKLAALLSGAFKAGDPDPRADPPPPPPPPDTDASRGESPVVLIMMISLIGAAFLVVLILAILKSRGAA